MRNKFIIFLIILAIGVGFVGFWYYHKNTYSKEELKFEILGPEEAEIFEEIEYVVRYKNNGNIRLEEPKLIFEYPKYSLVEAPTPNFGVGVRKEIKLKDIYPGEERAITFKTRLFGKEGERKEVKAWLFYRPKNLKARFESATTFTTQIKKVPLTFEFDLSSKIESGKEIKFALNYFSNVDYPISDLRVKIEYPDGFEFLESIPEGIGKEEWEIGLLNKAEGGRIEIIGKLRGEVGEEKIFRAELGSWKEGEFVLLKEAVRGITIVKPALWIWQQINGNPKFIANPGDLLHYEIFFKNIGEEILTDLTLFTTLTGSAFDFETIQAPEGETEPGDNSIIWDWKRVAKLQFLPPQGEGKVEFWIRLKEDWEIRTLEDKNPIIKNKIYLSQAREEFTYKVNSKLEIVQKGYFREEVFGNSGPIPPKVGETTTYTIMWQVKNWYNEMRNVKVKASLPKNVKLTGRIFPEKEAEKFTFDSQSREIIWNIEKLVIGQGILNPAPNIWFQISFTPDDAQTGQTPEIIGEAKITGEDGWTEMILEATASAIDTTLPDDQTVSPKQGIVL